MKEAGVVQISDISVGHGNYDSLCMVRSVSRHYALPALILEPDQPDKPTRTEIDGMRVERIFTSTPFRSFSGRVEFVTKVARRVDELRPRVLIVRCSWNIPVLLKLRHKPPLVIYHATESTVYYGTADPNYNRLARPMIDLIVFPEENRAAHDIHRCGFHRMPIAIAYNAPAEPSAESQIRPATARNGRFFYSGALDRNATYTDYYSHPELEWLPVDVFGYLGGSDIEATRAGLRSLAPPRVYRGFVDAAELEASRPRYAFSITIWNPQNENQRFACPCKFYESIAAGVPVVTAPHPQCKMIVERYGCGFVMEDWSFPAFSEALSRAWNAYNSLRYEAMVDGCRRALREELNWPFQFERVRRLLPDRV